MTFGLLTVVILLSGFAGWQAITIRAMAAPPVPLFGDASELGDALVDVVAASLTADRAAWTETGCYLRHDGENWSIEMPSANLLSKGFSIQLRPDQRARVIRALQLGNAKIAAHSLEPK